MSLPGRSHRLRRAAHASESAGGAPPRSARRPPHRGARLRLARGLSLTRASPSLPSPGASVPREVARVGARSCGCPPLRSEATFPASAVTTWPARSSPHSTSPGGEAGLDAGNASVMITVDHETGALLNRRARVDRVAAGRRPRGSRLVTSELRCRRSKRSERTQSSWSEKGARTRSSFRRIALVLLAWRRAARSCRRRW
jgi:hypothetical protein